MEHEFLSRPEGPNENFFRNVLGLYREIIPRQNDIVAKDDMLLLRYIGGLVAAINIFWIFYYRFRDTGMQPVGWYYYTLIAMTVLSLGAVALSLIVKDRWGNNLLFRISFQIFYAAIVAYVTAVTVSKNLELASLIRTEHFGSVGVSLVAYILITLAFTPLPSALDSALVLSYLVIGTILPMFLPGKEAYNIVQQAMLRACAGFAYIVYRKVKLNSAEALVSEAMMRDDIERRSCTEELTTALNLRAFHIYAKKVSADPAVKELGVFVYDADDFKQYNDYYSHTRGDEMLQRITACVRETLEGKNGYLFRYSGGEFLILLENCTEDEILPFAEHVRTQVYNRNFSRQDCGSENRLTITVGAALVSGDELETADIMTIAEQQIAIGKKSGKNCSVFHGRVYSGEQLQRFGEEPEANAPENPEVNPDKRNWAMIVGGNEEKRNVLSDILSANYAALEASTGAGAISLMWEHLDSIAVVLIADDLPDMSREALMEAICDKGWNKPVPIIMLMSRDAKILGDPGLLYGAADFLREPYSPVLVRLRVKNNIERFRLRTELERMEQTRIETLRVKNNELQQMNDRLIEITCDMVEARSMESGSHVRRVKAYVRALSEQLAKNFPDCGLTPEKINCITYMSAMHDVGKIQIRDSVLMKPGKLTDEEFEHMKTHTILGCQVLDSGKDIWSEEYFKIGYDIVRSHHEKYDGKGYPDGLKGEDIPLAAQIVSICDCFDALTTERVYKKAYSVESAYDMIVGGRCGAFSPRMLSAFLRARPKFERISELYQEKAAE